MIEIHQILPEEKEELYKLIRAVNRALVGITSSPWVLVEDWMGGLQEGVWEIFVAKFTEEAREEEILSLFPKVFRRKKREELVHGIIGMATLFGDYEWDEELEKGDFEIGVTVEKHFQRRGIGTKLTTHVIERGKELGYRRASFWTRKDNWSMRKIGSQLGFEEKRRKIENGFEWINYLLLLKN